MQQHLLVAAATVELSPAFQSRESSHIVVLVAAATVDTELQNQPSLPRLGTDALMVPALKSRAKLIRSLPRPGKSWLHYFFKDHKPTAKFKAPLTRRKTAIELFLSERDYRVHLHCPARRNETGEQRDADDHQRDERKYRRVCRPHFEKQGRKRASQGKCPGQT